MASWFDILVSQRRAATERSAHMSATTNTSAFTTTAAQRRLREAAALVRVAAEALRRATEVSR